MKSSRHNVTQKNLQSAYRVHRHKQQVKQTSKCPYKQECGACQLLDMTESEQLQYKQRKIRRLLGQYGPIQPIVHMKDAYYYRNKVHAVFKKERHGKIKAGTYKEGTHQVVGIKNCLMKINRLVILFKPFIN